MSFTNCIKTSPSILMEGALGERLKREYGIKFDVHIDMGGLVYSENGRKVLEELWGGYASIAEKYYLPFLATTPTRRTNRERLACTAFTEDIIKDNVAFLREVQQKQSAEMYVGGLVGCYGNAYTGENALDTESAIEFHTWETMRFAEAGVDFLYAALMPTLKEAAGMALAIEEYGLPYIISVTIRKDGCLIDGTLLTDAIKHIDSITKYHPVCYMTNCVHPRIVREALVQPGNQNAVMRERFLGLQANTSVLSYEELDGSKELHTTEPELLAEEMIGLRELVPLKIFGGCCGTDNRHMEEIAKRISENSKK